MLLNIVQIIISLILIILIILQPRGAGGLGNAFGGGLSEGNIFRARRGLEKIVSRATIFVAVLFILSILLPLVF